MHARLTLSKTSPGSRRVICDFFHFPLLVPINFLLRLSHSPYINQPGIPSVHHRQQQSQQKIRWGILHCSVACSSLVHSSPCSVVTMLLRRLPVPPAPRPNLRPMSLHKWVFLVNWLERFPEYKNRDFYMAGSSYAGHYIPNLAKLILVENNKTDKPINLKGFAIGNPYIDTYINTIKERYEFLWSHAMYSDETHTMLLKTCNMTSLNSTECLSVRSQADREIGGIDLFNIYAPHCHSNGSSSSNVKPLEYDPCNDYYVLDYLNNPSVQKTLHAVPSNWTFCSTWINIEHTTMLHTMKQLIASGLRVWLYSGDIDAVCPVTSTKSFIRLLKLPIESPWRPWYNIAEVGGYVVAYKGLTFVTVRGVGHEVPSYDPERALHVLSSFLQGKLP